MVRFFGKTRTTTKTAASKDASSTRANGAAPRAEVGAPPKPAPKTEAAAAPAAKAATKRATTTPRRRTTTTRPPRRDWAAEAAAAPIDVPLPKASSLATAPNDDTGEDAAAKTAAKRRRGTRGGRGRKKPGAIAEVAEAPAKPATPATRAEPVSLEAAIAQQSAALDTLTKEVTSTLRSLQTTLGELQSKVDRGAVTSHPRVGIFVDVPNLIYAAERRNINLDFGRILEFFTKDRELVRATAYAPISDDPQAKLETQRFVHGFVGLPYRLVTKPLKRFADGSMKANFDIELAIDILTMSDRLDVVVLMSGDGDFRRVVDLVASRGVRVEVVAFSEAASNELKTVADRFIDVNLHLDDFRARK